MALVDQSLVQMMSRELAGISIRDRRFLISVSGGRDSVALLQVMCQLREKYELELAVLHVNFRLRGEESDEDQAFVEKLSKSLGLNCFVHRVPRARKLSQEEAREIRLRASQALWPEALLVEAHHADDQVETFMFRLFRGTGLSGLKGMQLQSVREGRRVYRPFLQIHRSQIDAFIESHRLKFREDRSNAEEAYSRNWIRNKLSNKIEKRFPNFRESLLRLQSQIQEEEEYFEQECKKLVPQIVTESGHLKLEELRKLPKALLRRFLHFYFRTHFEMSLDRAQILELTQLILWERSFSWNAPQNWVARLGQDGLLRCLKAPGRDKRLKRQAKG